MEIINREKKEMIPLNNEENNLFDEQKICHICKEKFCTDKDDKYHILIEKGLKIIVIILEKLEESLIVFAST